MHIEIINTGSDILLGTTLNTHGAWMGTELIKHGLGVQRQTTVLDYPAMTGVISEAMEHSDAVIVSGGLEPTNNHISRDFLATVLGVELIGDETTMRSIKTLFTWENRPMAEGNRKQTLNSAGLDILANPNGTAPGIYAPPGMSGNRLCALFLLPGPPDEMKPMFHAEITPRLCALADISDICPMKILSFTGIEESDFHVRLDAALLDIPDLEIGYCTRPSGLGLRLTGSPKSIRQATALALSVFPGQCFSIGGESLEEVVIRLLSAQDKTITLAESCTGGRIASRITDVPGASAVFTHGFVTYANKAKQEMLDISKNLLKTHGSVSEEIARAMAEGALKKAGADIAVSVTGIAGPTGGTEDKPVGTVWTGLATPEKSFAVKKFYAHGREFFKQATSQHALDLIREELIKSPGCPD